MPSKGLLPKYLFFWSLILDSKKLTHDINYPSLRLSKLESAKISLPPLETQRRIVSILEKAEETTRLRAQADELTDRLLQSLFLEMFGDPVKNPKGWEKGKLGDFFSDVRYGVSTKSSSKGYPIIGMNSISYEGRIDWNDLSKVDLSPDIFQKEKLEKYDLLFNLIELMHLIWWGKLESLTRKLMQLLLHI